VYHANLTTGNESSRGRHIPVVRLRAMAVLAAGALAVVAAGCSTSSDGSTSFTPAAVGSRPLPSISAAALPDLARFTRQPDGSEVSVISSDYLFDEGSSTLLPAASSALAALAAKLVNYSGTIQVVGYTDGVGYTSSNQTLSEARAQAVSAQLVKDGVDSSILKVIGKGAEGAQQGVADSARRMVEIVLK
jgi:outer membrane protein OmpA-like peptidoglycan-associated protein